MTRAVRVHGALLLLSLCVPAMALAQYGGWYRPPAATVAADASYTPANGAHWTDPDPDDAAEGLDDIASRVSTLEGYDPDPAGAADGHVWTADGAGSAAWEAAGGGGGLSNVVDDATPQLGGDLDINGNSLVSTSNGDIAVAPNGTGRLTVSSELYIGDDAIEFEGSTADANELRLVATDPTGDRTITLPDETGTVHTSSTPRAQVHAWYDGAGDATDLQCAGNSTTTIIVDNEDADAGGDYNLATGVFTAPRAGWYCLAGHLKHSGSGQVYIVGQLDDDGAGAGGYTDLGVGSLAVGVDSSAVFYRCVQASAGAYLRFGCMSITATANRMRGAANYGDDYRPTHFTITEQM